MLDWDGKDRLILPSLSEHIVKKAWRLGSETPSEVQFRQHPLGLIVVVPPDHQDAIDTIIVLEMEVKVSREADRSFALPR